MKIVLIKYLVLLFLLALPLQSAICQNRIDSLKSIIPDLDGPAKLSALLSLTYELQYYNNQEYFEYASLGFELALADQDSNYLALFHIEMGYYDKFNGDYQKALNNFNRARIISERKKNSVNISKSLTALGTVYHELGLYDRALNYHSNSLMLKEQMGDSSDIGVSYNNIGLIYYKIDVPTRAIEYYEKSLNLKLKYGDSAACIVPYINLGLAHSALKTEAGNRNAVKSFKNAVDLSKRYEQFYRLGSAYNGIAQVFINENLYDSARFYLQLSIVESLKNNYKQLESSNYFLLAKLAFEENDYETAILHLNHSKDLLKIFKDKNRIKNNYGLFSEIYASRNMIDSAYYYQKRFSAMKDSIFNEDLANKMANVQIATIEEQSQRRFEVQEEAISKTKMFSIFLLSILVLSVALIGVIFKNYAQTNKINKKLNESRNEIQAQKEDLEKKNTQLAEAHNTIQRQNDVLTDMNQQLDMKVKDRTRELDKSHRGLEKAVRDLDQFIYKTSHDLRGPIATMQGVIVLGIMESSDPKSKEYFNTLHRVSNNLTNVLHRLIDVHETYQKKTYFELLDPVKEIKEVTDKLAGYFSDPELTIVTELQAEGPWNTDKHLFGLIIESMMRSAYEYKDRHESVIRIRCSRNSYNMTILVEDNGFGVRSGDEEKVFNLFFKGSPKPGSTGLELYTAKIAIEKLMGMIRLVRPAKDTIFEIVLPVLT